jgi:NADH pyrophosphatase NudC (nudix superfamily)
VVVKYCPYCGCELASKEIEGKTRLGCSSTSCPYVFWDNPITIVAAVVELKDSVVLVRNRGWPEKMFGLVSGFLERGETPEAAVLREVKEELGLETKETLFIGYYPFFEMNQLILAFHVRAEGTVVMGEELSEVRYVSPERLRPWSFGTGPAVKDWLDRRQKYSEE